MGEGVVEIVSARLDVSVDEQARLEKLLVPAERERAARLLSPVVRRRFIVARSTLRTLLGERLSVAPQRISFTLGKFGKPSVDVGTGEPSLQFNLSHSDDLAVYAFSSTGPVGVDVEVVRAIPESDDIAARMFSAREVAEFMSLPPGEKAVGFLNCWTRKEAVVKALGAGLSYPLESFVVSLSPGAEPAILEMDAAPGEKCGWKLAAFEPAQGFVGAVCSES